MASPFSPDQQVQWASFLRAALGNPSGSLRFETRTLRGGLDSAGVMHLTVRYEAAKDRPASRRFVVKRLRGEQAREARVYQEILVRAESGTAPSFAAVHHVDEECWLFLEPIRRINNWPWRDTTMSAHVLRTLV